MNIYFNGISVGESYYVETKDFSIRVQYSKLDFIQVRFRDTDGTLGSIIFSDADKAVNTANQLLNYFRFRTEKHLCLGMAA